MEGIQERSVCVCMHTLKRAADESIKVFETRKKGQEYDETSTYG